MDLANERKVYYYIDNSNWTKCCLLDNLGMLASLFELD